MQHMIRKWSVIAAALMLTGVSSVSAQNNQSTQNTQSGNPQSGARQSDNSSSEDAARNRQAASTPGQSGQTGSSQSQAGSQSQRYIDHAVITRQGDRIGTVELLWEDQSNEPAFLGVKRPGQQNLTIIPAEQAQVNEARKTIRVDLSAQALQSAPTIERTAELDEHRMQQVTSYYSQHAQASQPKQAAQSTEQVPSPTSRPDAAQEKDQATVQLKQEQATIGKRTVEFGGVLLRKVVRTETNQQPVVLQREELVIERIPGGGERAASAQFGADEIFIPLRREVPVVQKDVILKETVRVGKDVQEQTTNITTRLREEELKIQRQGQQEGTGAPGSVTSGRGTSAGSSGEQKQGDPQPQESKQPQSEQSEQNEEEK